jgi:hypothetical protein
MLLVLLEYCADARKNTNTSTNTTEAFTRDALSVVESVDGAYSRLRSCVAKLAASAESAH